MVHQPFRRQRPVGPWISVRQWCGSALYGRALRLPERTAPRGAPLPLPQHPILLDLRRYQKRLHWQRSVVTLARALAVATLAATVVLLLRAFGVAVVLPVAPLAVAGSVLVVFMASIPFQRPPAQPLAQALDTRLGLHELVGSALDVPPADARLVTRLHARARAVLKETDPRYVLPWPSLRRERGGLITVALVCAISALFAVHAQPVRPSAAVALGRPAPAHRAVQGATHRPRTLALPARLLGQIAALQHGHATSQVGHKAAPTGASTRRTAAGVGTGAGQRRLSSGALQIHQAQGRGHATTSGASGTPGAAARTAPPGASAAKGQIGAAGHPGALRLTAAKNSAAGGVSSPQQQQLVSLQNSISAAQSPQTNAQRNGNQSGAAAGHKNGGQGRNGAQGRSGAAAHGGRRSGTTPGGQGRRQGTQSGQAGNQNSRSQFGRNGAGGSGALGSEDPRGRLLHGAAPGGTGTGDPFNTATQGVRTGGAQLGNGSSDVALNGTPGGSGRLMVTLGSPARVPAGGSGSTPGAPTNAIVTVPGYVAPDSNAVAPEDRSAVQGYFSPPPNQ